jgi:hypothetical protein
LAAGAHAGCATEVGGPDDETDVMGGDLDVTEAGTCDPYTGYGAHPKVAGGWFQAIYTEIDGTNDRFDPNQVGPVWGSRIQFQRWVGNWDSVAYEYLMPTSNDRETHMPPLNYAFRDERGDLNGCERNWLVLTRADTREYIGRPYSFEYFCSVEDGVPQSCPPGPVRPPFADDRLVIRDERYDVQTMFRRCATPGCPTAPSADLYDEN